MNSYNDYKIYNDYELLYLINEGSEIAFNIFFKKYEIYIIKIVKEYVEVYDSRFEDLVQEGRMALFTCMKNYNDNLNTSFFTYFTVTIRRRILKLLNTDYCNTIVLEESMPIYSIENKKIYGRMFFDDPEKIELFDECIIGNTSLAEFSKNKKIRYSIVYRRYRKIIEELKIILDIK